MPWSPELFSAPVLERIRSRAADARAAEPVPYFEGVGSGEPVALIGSFAGVPELHHPVYGRVKGEREFERFIVDTNAWLNRLGAVGGEISRVVTPWRTVEETVLTVDRGEERIELPVATVAERDDDGRILELRIYYGNWPLTGGHAGRPPLLQPDPDLRMPDVVGDYHGALAAGDVDAALAAFEPDGYVREPAGGAFVHRGREGMTAMYERFFSNGGGIPLEMCAVTDDGRSCAAECNVVRWGRTDLPPAAAVAVHERGASGRLAAVRLYNDVDPPLAPAR
jgi:hypothetical protein